MSSVERKLTRIKPSCSTCSVASGEGGGFDETATITGVTAGQTYLIQVGAWSETANRGTGQFTVTNLLGACPEFGVEVSACDPANNHSGGTYAKLDTSAFGSGVGSPNGGERRRRHTSKAAEGRVEAAQLGEVRRIGHV